ncbi:hypothetical protein VTO73DRAFT_8441 [Trametes versicolor]
MGQDWKFFNLSRMQYEYPNGGYKLGIIFMAKQPFLVRSLTIPYPLPKLAKLLANCPPPGPIAKKGLLSLPDELIDIILYHDDLPILDSICLAVTCKKILAVAEDGLLKHGRDFGSALWAHCRIVCLGEYTQLDKAPDSLFPPNLQTKIHAGLKKIGMAVDEVSYGGLLDIENLCGHASIWLYRGVHENRRYVMKLPRPDRDLFVAAAAVTFPKRDDWALLNTTKYEYVRAGPIAELGGKPHSVQPFLEDCPIDLGTALYTRFCYSFSQDTAMVNTSVNIHRGKWVGDRFAIDTLERAVRSDTENKWKDVTFEVVEDIRAIYKDQWPEDWKVQLKKFHGPFDYACYNWDQPWHIGGLLPSPEEEIRRERRRQGFVDLE